MKHKSLAIFCTFFLTTPHSIALQASPGLKIAMSNNSFDLQGHRGARGVFPENTIPAFLYALDLGVTTLEMDVVINAEGKVYISHEPWMSADICSHPDGRKVEEDEARALKIYAMSEEEISRYDCGIRGHSKFPEQQALKVSKPLLSDMFEAVKLRTAETGREPALFNIEIKSAVKQVIESSNNPLFYVRHSACCMLPHPLRCCCF